MRKLIFSFALIFLFVTCERAFEPDHNYNGLQNPFTFTYDEEKEEVVQAEWNEFLLQYDAIHDTSLTHFMKSTSFISQVYFEDPLPKIFTDSNNTAIDVKLFQFYSEWENLFGCKMDNIEVEYTNNELGVFIVRFKEIKTGNTFCKFIYQPFIKFALTEQMELKSIISTLIPDVEIEIPRNLDWVDISKMIDNTIGLEYDFSPDGSSIYFPQKHLFSKTDTYHVNDGFEVYPEYVEDTLSIYYLKGIEYSWYEDNSQYKCTVYYHPSTTEIIHIKKW